MGNIAKIGSEILGKTVLLTLGSLLVFKEAAHATFDGFYAGGSLGYLQQNTHLDAKQNPANPNADVYSSTAGRGLPVAELFLGWGKVIGGCFYSGVEGQIDFVMRGSKKVAEDTNFMYLSGRKGPGLALLVRLGYLISAQTMIYGGVGGKSLNIENILFEKADKIAAPFINRSPHLLTEVGVETASSALKNLAFRFSYSFIHSREMIRKAISFPENHMYRRHGIFKSETTEYTFKLGIVYHF